LRGWFVAFFLEFKNRINEQYSGLFGQHIEDEQQFAVGTSFSQKWGWYNSIVKIARGNFFDIERAENANLHFALTFLLYLKEQDEEEAKQIQNKFKANE
jgi:hypothetical protein